MESKEERLLRAIFGNEPQAKAIKFSMNLDDLTVDVSIKKIRKRKTKFVNAQKDVSVEVKDNETTSPFKNLRA